MKKNKIPGSIIAFLVLLIVFVNYIGCTCSTNYYKASKIQ